MKTDVSTTQTFEPAQHTSASRLFSSRLAGRLRRRGPLLVVGIAALGAGMALNWGWLTAVGVAPIILALAPCALMCAVGICCSKEGNQA